MAKERSSNAGFIWKLIVFVLAAMGAYIVLGWALKLFSFVFTIGFWLLVLIVAGVVLLVRSKMDR